jgi:NADH-quinone oxidoreductase subunit G
MSQWPSDYRYTIAVAGDQDVVNLTIDGTAVQAPRGRLLIEVAQEHGTYIPRFCWHERMKPVGMCRMCLVEVEGARGLQISCATPVTEGMVVRTQGDAVKKAQDGVLEFLLINHPLDCPVCDRGGECPLQDQTLAFGPGESRYVEEKRHFEKPIPVSDLVLLDRERCIQCGRCTRFAAEIAGDPLIDFGGRGGDTEVITYPDEPFTSYFSGNTVQICPVGALTAQAYRFRARPWDLDTVETSCQTCAVGCRGALDSTSNRLVRMLGVDSDPVNQGWLCDKGRYGIGWVHSDARVRSPRVRRDNTVVEASWPEALDAAAAAIRRTLEQDGPDAVAVLGGARGTNEDAYVWARLTKSVLLTDNVDAQLGDGLPAEVVLGMPRATIDDLDRAKAIVLLGPDLKEDLPVLHLRVRRAVVDLGVPLIDVAARDHGLTRDASTVLRHAPGLPGDVFDDLQRALDAITDRDGPVVVVLGRSSVAESADATVHVAGRVLGLGGDVRYLSALRRANVHGALDLGLAPGFLPGRVTLDGGREHMAGVWGSVPKRRGLDAAGILRAAADGAIRCLVLVDCDPLTDFPDRSLAHAALQRVERLVVVGSFADEPAARADVFLPTTVWGEQAGSTTNLEGRVMRLHRKVTPGGTTLEGWRIAGELAARLGNDFDLETEAEVQDEIARVAPAFAGVDATLLRRARDGVVLPLAEHADEVTFGVARPGGGVTWEPIRSASLASLPAGGDTPPADGRSVGAECAYPSPPVPLHVWQPDGAAPPSGSLVDAYALRLLAARTLYGSDRIVAESPALARLQGDGAGLLVNPRDRERIGVDEGTRVRVTSSRGSLDLPLYDDRRTLVGTAFIAVNRAGSGAADLIDVTGAVTELRIETAPSVPQSGAGYPGSERGLPKDRR